MGTLGGALGGVVGYFLFRWLLSHGLYGLMIPGAAVGLGVGWSSREHSRVCGVLAGIAGLFLGLYARWTNFVPKADSFLAFLTDVHNLGLSTQIMIVLGAICAYWFGQGRERFVRPRTDSAATGEPSGSDHSPD